MSYPFMYRVRRAFAREREADPRAATARELDRALAAVSIRPGSRVAVTVGSRGIRDIASVAKTLVERLRAAGARPFIFPAMGSHGGATAHGQATILAHYGITEDTMECPILSSMETLLLGQSPEGIPVFIDRHAAAADHVVVLNRIKPHTDFKGEVESGLAKMLLIGMGKREGAQVYHRAFADFGFDRIVRQLLPIVLERARVLFGLAIVENAYEETALVRALLPAEMPEGERALLRKAKDLAPDLPFDELDVLIVDEMGKNLSGSGLDTNVIGRFYNQVIPEPERPRIKRIYVRSLTAESLGNACGIGLADYVHRDVTEKMDFEATQTNCIAGMNPEKARIPIVCVSDRAALDLCFHTIGLTPAQRARVIRIPSTLRLTGLELSAALAEEAAGRSDLEVVAGPAPMGFDDQGRLREISGEAPAHAGGG